MLMTFRLKVPGKTNYSILCLSFYLTSYEIYSIFVTATFYRKGNCINREIGGEVGAWPTHAGLLDDALRNTQRAKFIVHRTTSKPDL